MGAGTKKKGGYEDKETTMYLYIVVCAQLA